VEENGRYGTLRTQTTEVSHSIALYWFPRVGGLRRNERRDSKCAEDNLVSGSRPIYVLARSRSPVITRAAAKYFRTVSRRGRFGDILSTETEGIEWTLEDEEGLRLARPDM
jgi:hypothetical protein